MVSTKKSRSGHSTRYLHITDRSHSNTPLLINLQKPKTFPKLTTAAKSICSDLGFRLCKQVFVHYLVSILMICKLTRGYIYQVASREFSFAATCSEKQ